MTKNLETKIQLFYLTKALFKSSTIKINQKFTPNTVLDLNGSDVTDLEMLLTKFSWKGDRSQYLVS